MKADGSFVTSVSGTKKPRWLAKANCLSLLCASRSLTGFAGIHRQFSESHRPSRKCLLETSTQSRIVGS